MRKIIFLVMFAALGIISYAQDAVSKAPSGWKFGGALPAIAYDSDLGFRYGALGYIYDWGDGTYYPNYKKSIYIEWSRTTKGSGNNILQYDDRAFLGTNIRFTSEIAYLQEQALDFYGFNGYQAVFNPNFSTQGNADYRSRMFYRIDRRMLRGKFDFQFPLMGQKLRAYAGLTLFNVKIGSVNVDKLNKGKDPAEMLPSQDSVPGVYENYVKWGIIKPEEANGGFVTQLKTGLIYDTRNSEAQPTKGLWDELFLIGNTGIGGQSPYLQLIVTHNQYFSILPDKKLSFAYRMIFEGKLAGNIPFYMLPFYYNSKDIRDAFGGAKTARGILRDRIVANSVLSGNAELRWRVANFNIGSGHFYVALSAFADGIRVISPYNVDFSKVPANVVNQYFDFNTSVYKLHLSYGGGIRFAYNENTIVSVDYGMANDPQDGSTGLYIGLGWLF